MLNIIEIENIILGYLIGDCKFSWVISENIWWFQINIINFIK